jgi:acetylornithine/LysW-gamma-L-lysine aminotransferase
MEPRQNFLKLEKQYSLAVYPKRDLVIAEGKGSLVKDETGKEYIDCTAGHGVAGVGHGNEAVIQAITRQARRLITCSGTFYNDTRALLLEKLVNIAPAGLNRVFLCNSGTEAVEAALKLARLTTGKTDFICAVKGFHGRTMGALSATYNPKYKTEFLPLVPGFHFAPFNNISPLIKQVEENPDRFAGIILEPVQGEGGVHIGRQDYFREVRAICDERGIMLIIDEVQTGAF